MNKKTMVAIMDPPTSHTGFGTVSAGILKALASEFEVTLFATGGYGDQLDIKSLAQWGIKDCQNTVGDPHSYHLVDPVLNARQPDVVFIYKDTGSVVEFMDKTHISFRPTAAYLVAEGAPIPYPWQRLFKDSLYEKRISKLDFTLDAALVSSYFDAEEIKRTTGREVGVAYHGVDHANWRKFTKEERTALRHQLGARLNTPDLNDYFILMYVARNADRKMWPRLFETMRLIKDKRPDLKIKLLAYTKSFDMYKQGGWNLQGIINDKGLDDQDVIFPVRDKDIDGVPFDSNGDGASLMQFYNLADLYVAPTGGEACGLPVLEAARCGLPVLTTEYAGGWEYAKGFAMPIRVQDHITDKTGLNWALVDREDLANKIITFATNKAIWHQYSNKSLNNCNYKWEALGEACVKAAYKAVQDYKWQRN